MALCNPLREYLISSLSLSYSLVISVFSLFPAQTRSLPVSPYFSPSSFLSSCCETSLLASPRDVGLLLVSLRAEYKMEKKKNNALHADGCKLHLPLPLSAGMREYDKESENEG